MPLLSRHRRAIRFSENWVQRIRHEWLTSELESVSEMADCVGRASADLILFHLSLQDILDGADPVDVCPSIVNLYVGLLSGNGKDAASWAHKHERDLARAHASGAVALGGFDHCSYTSAFRTFRSHQLQPGVGCIGGGFVFSSEDPMEERWSILCSKTDEFRSKHPEYRFNEFIYDHSGLAFITGEEIFSYECWLRENPWFDFRSPDDSPELIPMGRVASLEESIEQSQKIPVPTTDDLLNALYRKTPESRDWTAALVATKIGRNPDTVKHSAAWKENMEVRRTERLVRSAARDARGGAPLDE